MKRPIKRLATQPTVPALLLRLSLQLLASIAIRLRVTRVDSHDAEALNSSACLRHMALGPSVVATATGAGTPHTTYPSRHWQAYWAARRVRTRSRASMPALLWGGYTKTKAPGAQPIRAALWGRATERWSLTLRYTWQLSSLHTGRSQTDLTGEVAAPRGSAPWRGARPSVDGVAAARNLSVTEQGAYANRDPGSAAVRQPARAHRRGIEPRKAGFGIQPVPSTRHM
jgi:hypothetical protein